jgi:glycosyltransferase involved in cell wall biosynthesis
VFARRGCEDSRRVLTRLAHWAGSFPSIGLRSESPNLSISSPVVLPPLGKHWRRELNRRLFLPQVRHAADKLGLRNPVVMTFLPTDTALDLIHLVRGEDGVVVYYCAADFAELASRPKRIAESERELLSLSDLVLAQCPILASHCSQWARNIHIMPYGVNIDAFTAPADNGNGAHKVNARDLPRPVIGYVGGLHRHVDLQLLTAMAQSRPDWSWVCVGPTQTPFGKLASLPNVHLLGEFRHHELAAQIEIFDVGIVPYVSSVFTNTVVPTKINEYLAMGKPVVSTNLRAICDYYHWPEVVLPCEPRHDSFLAAIETALVWPGDDATKTRRRDVARLSDWPARLDVICDLIESVTKTKSVQNEKARSRSASA